MRSQSGVGPAVLQSVRHGPPGGQACREALSDTRCILLRKKKKKKEETYEVIDCFLLVFY